MDWVLVNLYLLVRFQKVVDNCSDSEPNCATNDTDDVVMVQ